MYTHKYFTTSTHLPHVPQLLSKLDRQAYNVVFTDRHDLHGISVLVVEDVAAHVMRDQLLGCLISVKGKHKYLFKGTYK